MKMTTRKLSSALLSIILIGSMFSQDLLLSSNLYAKSNNISPFNLAVTVQEDDDSLMALFESLSTAESLTYKQRLQRQVVLVALFAGIPVVNRFVRTKADEVTHMLQQKENLWLEEIIIRFGDKHFLRDQFKIEDESLLKEVLYSQALYLAEELYLMYYKAKGRLQEGVVHYLSGYSAINSDFDSSRAAFYQEHLDHMIRKVKKQDVSDTSRLEELKSLLLWHIDYVQNEEKTLYAVPNDLAGAKEFFQDESNTSVRMKNITFLPEDAHVFVVSDFHGDSLSAESVINEILEENDFAARVEKGENVFISVLGDHTSMGTNSIDMLISLIKLKKRFPKNVLFVEGNEDQKYTFLGALGQYFGFLKGYFSSQVAYPHDHPLTDKSNGLFISHQHLRLEMIEKFGANEGEGLHTLYQDWVQELGSFIVTLDGLWMSHTLGMPTERLASKKGVTLRDLQNVQREGREMMRFLGGSAWSRLKSVSSHSAFLNGTEGKEEIVLQLQQLGFRTFVLGHSHAESGDIDTLSGSPVIKITSQNGRSLEGGFFLLQGTYYFRKLMNKLKHIPFFKRKNARPVYAEFKAGKLKQLHDVKLSPQRQINFERFERFFEELFSRSSYEVKEDTLGVKITLQSS